MDKLGIIQLPDESTPSTKIQEGPVINAVFYRRSATENGNYWDVSQTKLYRRQLRDIIRETPFCNQDATKYT